MKYKLKILDGPMPHPAHHLVFELLACIEAPSLLESEYHLLLDTEMILEKVLGYRIHITQEDE